MRNRHRFGFSVACRIDMHAETSDLVAGGGGVSRKKRIRDGSDLGLGPLGQEWSW